MANICDNKFYFFIENDNCYDDMIVELNNLFSSELFGEITYSENNIIEGWFESKWTFPITIFENLMEKFKNDHVDSIYFRCLSEELGCNYIAMNIYTHCEWIDEQTFELYS